MNINQVTLIGNLTKDPEYKTYAEGKHLTRFSLATNRKIRGTDKDEVEFHTVVTFGRLAEICRDYLKKGRLIFLQGRLKTSSWEDAQKNKHIRTDVIGNEMIMLEKPAALVSAVSQFGDDATEAIVEVSKVATS